MRYNFVYMTEKQRKNSILDYFRENVPVAESELDFKNPYQLIVAVILSAQCTDKRVNMHTPAFFLRFPTPELLAQATFEEVYDLIKSISFPNNKAKHLIGMAKMLVSDFREAEVLLKRLRKIKEMHLEENREKIINSLFNQ